MTAVAIYARYSSDMQREASIEDQIRLCRERSEREGWQIFDCYKDRGISGASLMRPAVQMLLGDARAGRFQVVLAESLDRLSRDQEDIAHIYKRFGFEGIKIVTLSEGEVNELHIGLKGTMGALYLKDLADKTRRGLRGRVEAGKSGGGKAYGYDVVRAVDHNGDSIHGERRINPSEARIVERIFRDYADGVSPRTLVHQLNAEGIPGPSGKGWGPSTIHGNRQRGTGILNNELYIGRLVWNRLRYVKDPETGKRISRLNDQADWIIQDVAELRIIDQDLWDRVKARQGALTTKTPKPGEAAFWDRRRPRYLFSGLITCGVCGGGAATWNRNVIGCVNRRNKGTCDNGLTIKREDLEALVLDGLEKHLMDPEHTRVFCEHYTKTMNRLVAEHNAGLEASRSELERIDRQLDKLVEALMNGVPAARVKDKMQALEDRKVALEQERDSGKQMPVSLHPNLSAYYREQIGELRSALQDESKRAQAAEAIRALIDKIELVPTRLEDGTEVLAVDLHGKLAEILTMALKSPKPLKDGDPVVECTKLVAGVGFEPTTFRL